MSTTAFGILAALAAAGPASAAPAIDNPRVSVWEATLAKGQTGPAAPRDLDAVVMYLDGGRVRVTSADGKSKVVVHKGGDAVFVHRGAGSSDTLLSEKPLRQVVIALKDAPSPKIVNDSKLPAAFPRPGSVKLIDNDRVVVWNYRWTAGKPTPMHFHDKEVVVAYRVDSDLASNTPDGKRVVNRYKSGEVKFNPARRVHSELLVGPQAAAVMTELK